MVSRAYGKSMFGQNEPSVCALFWSGISPIAKIPACCTSQRNAVSSPSVAVTVTESTTSNTFSSSLLVLVSMSSLISGFHSLVKIAGAFGDSKEMSFV